MTKMSDMKKKTRAIYGRKKKKNPTTKRPHRKECRALNLKQRIRTGSMSVEQAIGTLGGIPGGTMTSTWKWLQRLQAAKAMFGH